LQERVQWVDADVVSERLKSHLISYDLLSKAHYIGMKETAFKQKLAADFSAFLRDRAYLVVAAMTSLTEGRSPSLDTLWAMRRSVNTGGAEVAA
jgi:predicted protein tyrosine phosphatase